MIWPLIAAMFGGANNAKTSRGMTKPRSRRRGWLRFTPGSMPWDVILGQRDDGPFMLSESDIASRMAILGASGSGKSRLLFLLLVAMMMGRRGFLQIDPNGDLAHSALAWAAARIKAGDSILAKRLHFLEPSKTPFTFDPFASAPRNVPRDKYYSWLKAAVDRICRNILRRVSESDQEIMLRLRRWLKNVLYACGVAVDANNTHVGLHKALVFLNPDDPEFPDLYRKVAPHLPREVRADFEALIQTPKPLDRERWTESTTNRLRDLLSPLVEKIFTPREDSLNISELIRSSAHILVSLQETDSFSHDEKVVIGGLLIDAVLLAKLAEENEVSEEKRVPFVLSIDEFSEFIGEDLLRAFPSVRKYRLSIIVATQNLSTLKKGSDLDLASAVISQCHTKVVFNMTWPEDLEVLAKSMGYGNIDFDELIHEVERHGGYDWIPVVESSLTRGRATADGQGGSNTNSIGGSTVRNTSVANQDGWTKGKTRHEGSSDGETTSDGEGVAQNANQSESLDIKDGQVQGRFPVFGAGKTVTANSTQARMKQNSLMIGETNTESGSRTVTNGIADGSNWSHADGASWNKTESENWSISLAFKYVTLARIVREQQRTGRLEMSVQDQFEKIKQQIHGLLPRFCFVKRPGEQRAFFAEVGVIRSPFMTVTARERAMRELKEELYRTRPYYVPFEDDDPVAIEVDQPEVSKLDVEKPDDNTGGAPCPIA